MGKPYLTVSSVISEINKRTGVPLKDIHTVLVEFFDIVKQSILHGVEVRFKGIGAFSFRDNYPMKNVVAYDPARKCKRLYEETVGYRVPKFRFTEKWRAELKNATLITYDEFWGKEDKNADNETKGD